MAQMNKGFAGGLTGKLGDKVGYVDLGSPGQIAQRAKFCLMSQFLYPLWPFMNEMRQTNMKSHTGYHKFFSKNLRESITGNYPDFSIDYKKIQLTQGSLPLPEEIWISYARSGFIDFRWRGCSWYNSHEKHTDQLYLAIYHEENEFWETKRDIADREDESCILDLTPYRGSQLQIYSGFRSADRRRVSNSRYIGMINIL